MEDKKDIFSTVSTVLLVAGIVQKASKGRAKNQDFEKVQATLGPIGSKLEAINNTVKLVGKAKKFIKNERRKMFGL